MDKTIILYRFIISILCFLFIDLNSYEHGSIIGHAMLIFFGSYKHKYFRDYYTYTLPHDMSYSTLSWGKYVLKMLTKFNVNVPVPRFYKMKKMYLQKLFKFGNCVLRSY